MNTTTKLIVVTLVIALVLFTGGCAKEEVRAPRNTFETSIDIVDAPVNETQPEEVANTEAQPQY